MFSSGGKEFQCPISKQQNPATPFSKRKYTITAKARQEESQDSVKMKSGCAE
jgi:hypothetical protein